MKKLAHIACLILISLPFKGISQSFDFFDDDEDFRRVRIGIGAGGFFAGRHPANFYNGHPENQNKLTYAFRNSDFVRNLDRQIQEKYRTDESSVSPRVRVELPERMSYRVATAVSFRASFHLSPFTSIFFGVNQVNLTATDILVLVFPNPGTITEPIRVQGRIWGRESRTMLDVGFQWNNDMEAHSWQWFYELGFNVVNTRVRENMIEIEGLRHTIMDQGNHIPGIGWSTVAHPETAWGVGVLGSFGWRYVINRTASLDFGATAYLHDINLTGFTRFHMSFNLFARLNFLMF